MIEYNIYNILMIWVLFSLNISLILLYLEQSEEGKDLLKWEAIDWSAWITMSILLPIGLTCIASILFDRYSTSISHTLLKKRTFALAGLGFVIPLMILYFTIIAIILFSD